MKPEITHKSIWVSTYFSFFDQLSIPQILRTCLAILLLWEDTMAKAIYKESIERGAHIPENGRVATSKTIVAGNMVARQVGMVLG